MGLAAGGGWDKQDADLAPHVVGAALPGRPTRSYPAVLSTEADALAWARAGGPAGAVVVAGYQASPRGRGGLPWHLEPGRSVGFSLLLRPDLPPQREGWPYVAATDALAGVAGPGARTSWPDEVVDEAGGSLGAVGVQTGLGPDAVEWVVVTAHLRDVDPPRAPRLAAAVEAIERRCAEDPDVVLEGYRTRCVTLGREVRARLAPLGPRSPEFAGTAVDCSADGALVIDTGHGRVHVNPQHLGVLEQ